MDVLIGSTGLIGGILQEHQQFNHLYNSSNLYRASLLNGTIDKLYLACLPAEKWKANQNPARDFFNMQEIAATIRPWEVKEIILYSTIDIYKHSFGNLDYGRVRRIFELLVKAMFPNSAVKIIRLPALFHKRIKKNVLFDLLNDNNVDQINGNSAYQWYDLNDLWQDTLAIEEAGIYDLFSEPIETQEILDRFFPEAKVSYSSRIDYHCGSYKYGKEEMLAKMEAFINAYRN